MMELIQTTQEDLEHLFRFQHDEVGVWMAAFTAENPADKEFYMNKWSRIIVNPEIRMQTIWINDAIAGSVAHFDLDNLTHVAYWIDRQQWGKGIATRALQQFVAGSTKRPLYARVAFDNIGSQRVLEKNWFYENRDR